MNNKYINMKILFVIVLSLRSYSAFEQTSYFINNSNNIIKIHDSIIAIIENDRGLEMHEVEGKNDSIMFWAKYYVHGKEVIKLNITTQYNSLNNIEAVAYVYKNEIIAIKINNNVYYNYEDYLTKENYIFIKTADNQLIVAKDKELFIIKTKKNNPEWYLELFFFNKKCKKILNQINQLYKDYQ
jgi:hypothetical protein